MSKDKVAKGIFPNAGVEAWYRDELQQLVRTMSQDLLDGIRAAWKEGGGLATDAALKQAAGVIFHQDEFILLLRRTDGQGWAFPGGGVERGETHEQAARREVREEIGLNYEGPLTPYRVQPFGHVRFTTFLADVDDFIPQLNDEHDRWRWIPWREAFALSLHHGVRETLTTLDDVLAKDMALDAPRKKPSTSLLMQRALDKWGKKWIIRLDKTSTRIALQFANKSKQATTTMMMKQLADAGFTVKFKPSERMVEAYDAVVAEQVGLIRSIPQKYLGDVQNVIWNGVMAGSDMAAISDNLSEKYGIAHRRAALIARDQNHKAKAAFEKAQRLELGITEAIWQHSHAGKDPRPSHVAMDDERYDIRKGMWDPAVQKRIWPGTEINCRCIDKPVIPGFKI
jgi:8-oxo-dGTP pyrophosphatase MutT (NUDIX family)